MMAKDFTQIRMRLGRHLRDVLHVLIPVLVFALCVFTIVRIWSTCLLPPQATGRPAVERDIAEHDRPEHSGGESHAHLDDHQKELSRE